MDKNEVIPHQRQTPLDTNIKADNWIDSQTFFPVFQFSDTSIGIVFTITQDKPRNNFDSLYSIAIILDSIKISAYLNHTDTGLKDANMMIHNKWLEDKIFKVYNSSFYLYCTKGNLKVNTRNVIYNYTDCGELFIAIRLQNINIEKYGHPLFCSKNEYHLTYGHFEKEIKSYNGKVNTVGDTEANPYQNRFPDIVFAKVDSFYFAYNDNFKWGSEVANGYKYLFPDRTIYILRKRQIFYTIYISIDLWGVPCD